MLFLPLRVSLLICFCHSGPKRSDTTSHFDIVVLPKVLVCYLNKYVAVLICCVFSLTLVNLSLINVIFAFESVIVNFFFVTLVRNELTLLLPILLLSFFSKLLVCFLKEVAVLICCVF